VLSHITHWPLEDILQMEEEEFFDWHKTAVAAHNEMNGG